MINVCDILGKCCQVNILKVECNLTAKFWCKLNCGKNFKVTSGLIKKCSINCYKQQYLIVSIHL